MDVLKGLWNEGVYLTESVRHRYFAVDVSKPHGLGTLNLQFPISALHGQVNGASFDVKATSEAVA